jgi:hypothetical protein
MAKLASLGSPRLMSRQTPQVARSTSTTRGAESAIIRAPERFTRRLSGAVHGIRAELGEGGTYVALVLTACILVLAAMNVAHQATGSLSAFDVNGEVDLGNGLFGGMNVPALFSGAVLFVAAALELDAPLISERMPWAGLGGLFAFMGIDELVSIHENLELWTGVPWQVVYLPILAAGGAFWLKALLCIRDVRAERLLWLGGAAAWILAQILEVIANAGTTSLYGEMSWAEEILEMAGSSMFLLAAYLLIRRQAPRQFAY